MTADGTWTVSLTLPAAGSYRVFADFKHDGRKLTLARDVSVAGPSAAVVLPAAKATATAAGGYIVRVDAGTPVAGRDLTLRFDVTRAGRPVALQPYLGARGHLVALRSSDLAYLHVHPTGGAEAAGRVSFATEFATAGRYRLYLLSSTTVACAPRRLPSRWRADRRRPPAGRRSLTGAHEASIKTGRRPEERHAARCQPAALDGSCRHRARAVHGQIDHRASPCWTSASPLARSLRQTECSRRSSRAVVSETTTWRSRTHAPRRAGSRRPSARRGQLNHARLR